MPEPACAQPETCWEGGLFHFAIEFPQGYPFKPFKLWLETKMYHPNVSVQGEGEGEGEGGERREFAQTFASAMLRRWSPAHTVRKGAPPCLAFPPNLQSRKSCLAATDTSKTDACAACVWRSADGDSPRDTRAKLGGSAE